MGTLKTQHSDSSSTRKEVTVMEEIKEQDLLSKQIDRKALNNVKIQIEGVT